MADYNSSLPVRTEGDATEKLQVRVIDGVTDAQYMSVDADFNAQVKLHAKNSAGNDVFVRASNLGDLNTSGIYDASDNTVPSNSGLIAHTRDAMPDASMQTQRITSITNSTVRALDISLHDEAGAAYSASNPLPVAIAIEGTKVVNYDTSSAIAAAASDNHDYAVASGVFSLMKVHAAASGKMKVEVQWTTDNSTFTTLAVGFNSTANPNVEFDFVVPYALTGGANAKIRVIRTNLDNQSQAVYSTIFGVTV